MADKIDTANDCGNIPSRDIVLSTSPNESTDGVDRRALRKSRKDAAKKAKRIVRQRYDDVLGARPVNSRPADQILRAAVALYSDGPIPRRNLKAAISKLEANIRRELPDLAALRAPRSVSLKPERVGLMIYETRAITEQGDRIITAENHSVVLEEGRVVFISGLFPGGTRPHLFERIHERESRRKTMAEVLLQLSDIWPTLLWMRTEQRRHGRGAPLKVVMTPFANGLLFGSLDKVEGIAPTGPTVAVVDRFGQQSRQTYDFYGDGNGNRLWAMSKTFVDASLLAPDQLQLRDMLRTFVATYSDIVADNNWKWRVGLGDPDPAVGIVAETFKLTIPTDKRRRAGLAALEAIVASEAWLSVAANTLASQQRQFT